MILNLAAFFIIPGYTLLFIRNFNLFSLNFFRHRKYAGRKRGVLPVGNDDRMVLLLGSVQGICPPKLSRGVRYLVHTALFLLFCAVTTPYLPEELPFKAFLHIVFSMAAALCLCSICFSPPGGCERRTGQPDWLRCGVWQAFSSCLPFC